MAFTVKFADEETRTFDGKNDAYSIDSAGVLHLTYTHSTAKSPTPKHYKRALSPNAWLEVSESSPGSPVSPIN